MATQTSHGRIEGGSKSAGDRSLTRRLVSSLRHRLHGGHARPHTPPSAPPPKYDPSERVYLHDWQYYCGYSDEDRALFDEFPPVEAAPEPGMVINFLGVRTRVSFVNAFQRVDGQVTGTPLPVSDGFFSETIEYVGLLKSVKTAKKQYRVLEFGAGWAPWLVAGAAAAKRKGIRDIRLHGVEGDADHFASMVTHFQDNGLDPAEHRLDNAAVGVTAGTARWPKLPNAAGDWGARPLEAEADPKGNGGTDYLGRSFQEHVDVKVIAFREILEREAVWDLVHIDIQGTEDALCTAEAATLKQRVRWLVIGTHSRKIEGDLIDLFFRNGWILENERAAHFRYKVGASSLESMTYNDGTQIWRNPNL